MTEQVPDANRLIRTGGEEIHYRSCNCTCPASRTNGKVGDGQRVLTNRPDWFDGAIHIIKSSDDFGHVPLANESVLRMGVDAKPVPHLL